MKFTESHEWIDLKPGSNIATVGVTSFAQKELGEIVYVELPQIGKKISAGSEAAVLESTKAAADVYAPVSGTIVEVNNQLKSASELINNSPEKDGWIFKIQIENSAELDKLMDEAKYKAQLR
jgi:glycine cleavage system H protein